MRDVADEAPETTAARELAEEVGLRPDALEPLGSIYPSVGMTDSVTTLFLADHCTPVPRTPHGTRRSGRRRPRGAPRRSGGVGAVGTRRSTPNPSSACCRRAPAAAMNHAEAAVELPIEAEEFLSWLLSERGRAANTLAAYRRDLLAYARWLTERGLTLESVTGGRRGRARLGTAPGRRRARRRSPASSPRSGSLHRFLVIEEHRGDDPTADVEGVRIPAAIPKALSEAEVATLLAAVTGDDPLARRDRALLELLYGTGARIWEVVRPVDGRHRLRRPPRPPVRQGLQGAHRAVRAAPPPRPSTSGSRRAAASISPPTQWRRRDDATAVFLNSRGARLSRQAAWAVIRKYGDRAGLDGARPVAARAAPQVRHAPARPRRRPARRARAARARLDLDDAGVHQGQPGAPLAGVPRRPSAGADRRVSGSVTSGHLARRFWGSLSRTPTVARRRVRGPRRWLDADARLWVQYAQRRPAPRDRREPGASASVGRRRRVPEMAGALLHDVGKLARRSRYVRTCRRHRRRAAHRRFRRYHDHEAIGADMAAPGRLRSRHRRARPRCRPGRRRPPGRRRQHLTRPDIWGRSVSAALLGKIRIDVWNGPSPDRRERCQRGSRPTAV